MVGVDFTARLRRVRRKTKPHLSTAASAKVEGFASRFCLQKNFKKTPTNRGGFTASRNGGPATNRLRFRGIFSRKAMNTFAVNCIFVQCMNSLHLQKTLSALVLSGGPLRFGEAGHFPGMRDYGLASLVSRGVRRIKSSGEAFHTPLSRRNSVGPISELSSTKRSLFFHTPRAF